MAKTTKKRKQPSKWQQGVQNQAGVEQGKGGFKLRRGKKNAPRGKSESDKDKTDNATTNKQDPRDTPAG